MTILASEPTFTSAPIPPRPEYTSSSTSTSTSASGQPPTPSSSPSSCDPQPQPLLLLDDTHLETQLNRSTLNLYQSTSFTFLTYYIPRLLALSGVSFILRRWVLDHLLNGVRWIARNLLRFVEGLVRGVMWITSWGIVYGILSVLLLGGIGGILMVGVFEYPRWRAKAPRIVDAVVGFGMYAGPGWIGYRYLPTWINFMVVIGVLGWKGTGMMRRGGRRRKVKVVKAESSTSTRSSEPTSSTLDAIDPSTRARLEALQRASQARRNGTGLADEGREEQERGTKDDEEDEGGEEMEREAERWARKAREEMLREGLTRRARGQSRTSETGL